MTKVALSKIQLTLAQLGKTVPLGDGFTLDAIPVGHGGPRPEWKYLLCWSGQLGCIRYLPVSAGVEWVEYWLNASDDEYRDTEI